MKQFKYGSPYFNGNRVLIVCLSDDKILQKFANDICKITNGILADYLSDYENCTDEYEIVFVGCTDEKNDISVKLSYSSFASM